MKQTQKNTKYYVHFSDENIPISSGVNILLVEHWKQKVVKPTIPPSPVAP